ncbi:MAG TPA: hypothetical protein VK524_17295 [Polyangiaceae bacterium]|nr:hypothetical protein [Polyangiaceae bacterium]
MEPRFNRRASAELDEGSSRISSRLAASEDVLEVATPPAADSSAPFLLTMPEYNGTLAAARCLGQRGIAVTMAGTELTAPARWSRYVTRWMQAPSVTDPERFMDWLLEFGAREPKHVLYPTCDDLAWLFAERAAELRRYFWVYQPTAQTVLQLLDKKALHQTCAELDIPTLHTFFPANVQEAQRAARELGFPVLLKPRTQITLSSRSKGMLVGSADTLARDYARFMEGNTFHPLLARRLQQLEQPMLQTYRAHAAGGIYCLAGFVAPNHEDAVARGAMKIFQRPRRLGVGLCFEEAAVDRGALDAILRLCRKVNYFGVFEAEFVPDNGQLHLLDFNPRFYGQMGFETGRALPLGYMVYLAALGKTDALKEAMASAATWQEGRGYIYCHRFYLHLLIALRRVAGRMNPEEAARWRNWLNARAARHLALDPTISADDNLPALVSAAHEVYKAVRHPRSFLLANVLD